MERELRRLHELLLEELKEQTLKVTDQITQTTAVQTKQLQATLDERLDGRWQCLQQENQHVADLAQQNLHTIMKQWRQESDQTVLQLQAEIVRVQGDASLQVSQKIEASVRNERFCGRMQWPQSDSLLQLEPWQAVHAAEWKQAREKIEDNRKRLQIVEATQLLTRSELAKASETLQTLDSQWSDRQKVDLERHKAALKHVHEQTVKEQQEIWTVIQSRDRKLKQQMQLLVSRQDESEQLVKLVSKQLIENTSQLQLLQVEQQQLLAMQRDVELGQLMAAASEQDEFNDALEPDIEQTNPEMDALRAHHAQLQAAIQDKLRDYQQVLEPKQ